ncbi:phage protein Gp27 family protein [Pseudomonas aeruginosa]|uniref:phage protein Gp27 family protein n=1 Tax=Pseudomonas aeruginosa TaxID=287 RepID=UPI00053DBC15|nr:phage protein Gp27 family protein [Pseudomonas aeruginosa]EJA3268150.1 DUF3486 family protein [Pseudomonas aeruginosa]EKU0578170.1 DUF3486 family protein [Pseudomonas aeruginosa]ELM5227969.1 DUF3486 family protein [Pseudomonas aeruginosa]ELP1422310.1 DUF3486 family protein [Pseudomonas aeruginosa]ELQ7930201.1 DUF3486 family protein [Pseudomonas aeruginosa]
MGRTRIINKLPSTVREALISRAADRPGLTLDEHVRWLEEQGYNVSRSALHRFLGCRNLNPSDGQDQAMGWTPDHQSIRFGCLIAASICVPAGDKSNLMSTAEELLEWVKGKAPI